MSNKIKDISLKNHTYFFFNNVLDIKEFDPNNIKIDEKSHKNILVYQIGYMRIKDLKYVKVSGVKLLYLIFSKVII